MKAKLFPEFKNMWSAFLKIPRQSTADTPATVDPAWLRAVGMEPEAPTVLRMLKTYVQPLVNVLSIKEGLEWFCFLVHDIDSGVPAEAGDKDAYIHLNMSFGAAIVDLAAFIRDEPKYGPWTMIRRSELSPEVAGVKRAALVDEDIRRVHKVIGQQSKLILSVLEMYKDDVDDVTLVTQMAQFLHLFSNMAQMVVR